jgi:hypothetical protein
MTRRWLVAGVLVALTATGTAVGYSAGRVLTVRPGDRADFPLDRPGGGGWSCTNLRGRFVRCFSGDAYPYVKVGIPHRCGCVAVKVYMLSGPVPGHVTRTSERGRRVYTFTSS